MKKIYNKKKFFSGIVFLILAVVTFFAMSIPSIDKSVFRIMESIVIGILCFLFGITEVYRSLNKKCTKEDRQNDDEREKLINLKSKSKSLDIIFGICTLLTIIFLIMTAITKNYLCIAILITMSSFLTIILIVELSTYFYYNKQN